MKVYLIVSLLLGVTASAAFAQEEQDEQSEQENANPAASEQDAAARTRFQAGSTFYEGGHYEEALIEFEAAWDLSQRPEMLFNVANAAERSFDHARAASALEEYLELVPGAEDEDVLRLRIQRNHTAAERAGSAGSMDEESGSSLRLAGWLTIGGAGVIGVASLITGVVSHSTHSDLEGVCTPTCPADRAGDIDRGRTLATVSTVLTGVALAAGIAGIVLVIVGRDGDDEDTSGAEVAVLPSLGGASIRVRY